MKDRAGYDYAELLAIQRDQLEHWRHRIRLPLFSDVRVYVIASNLEARKEGDKHRVYRGQDIVEIIRLWPDLGPAYEPRQSSVLQAASDDI